MNNKTVFDPLEGDDYNQDDEVTRGAARVMPASQPMLGTAELLQGGYSFEQPGKSDLKGKQPYAHFAPEPEVETEEIVRSRGGAVWEARSRPEGKDFYYRGTALHFASGEKVHELVEKIYQFCDREYTVEVQKVNPAKGTFNLAVFVKEALVMVKLRLWKEASKKIVMEIELRDGEPLAFGMVYRTVKNYLQPSSTATEQQIMDNIDDLDMSLDVLMAQGVEFPAPEPEEWNQILEECDVLTASNDSDAVVNSATVASSVEALSSIAQTYEPEDLEFLSKSIADKKIGFVHDKYDVEKSNAKYQQLW